MGYSVIRTAARDPAVIGNGNGPIGISSTRALRDPGGNGIVKMSSGGCDLELPGLWFSQRIKEQATSSKRQATSIKLQATSSKLQDLRTTEKFHGARTEVLNADEGVVRMLHMEGYLVW